MSIDIPEAPTTSIDLIGRTARLPHGITTTVTAVDGANAYLACTPGTAHPLEEIVTLPMPGELVDLGGAQVAWLHATSHGDDWHTVSVLEHGSVSTRTIRTTDLEARRHVTGTLPTEQHRIAIELARVLRERQEWQENAERERDQMIADAHQWADDNDLCVRFDDFMDEHGMPRRTREYEVFVDVRSAICLTVEATDEEHARGQVTSSMVADNVGMSVDDWDIDDVREG